MVIVPAESPGLMPASSVAVGAIVEVMWLMGVRYWSVKRISPAPLMTALKVGLSSPPG